MGFKLNFRWLKSGAIWHFIFILIIIYCVSSINVLVLAIGILPYIQGAFLNTRVLVYFSEIAFLLAAFLGVYHVCSIFRTRKRRHDKTEVVEKPSAKESWLRSRFMNKLLFFVVIIYFAISVYHFMWAFGIMDKFIQMDDEILFIWFAILSFALSTLLSAFHLATLIFRQKRAADHLARAQRAAAIDA